MVYDAARSRRDEEMRQWHDQALAAGQQRVLARTTSGELHSYAKDELGVVTASSHPPCGPPPDLW